MAIQTIGYDNKSYINQNQDIPNVNKVTDNDMNEIKSVVNNNASELLSVQNESIIETGGNTNTNFYIKYSNGILVQYGKMEVTVAIQTAMNNVFRSANPVQKNLVESFADNDYYVVASTRPALNSCYINTTDVDNFTIYPICYASTTAATRYVYFIAIGRWQ